MIDSALPPLLPIPFNVRDEPTHTTVEHDEIGTMNGSSHNDHQSQEPSITSYQTHVNHSAWRLYRPTVGTDAVRNLSTSSHRQIRCDHPDITAIKIWTADTQILIFSVYLAVVPLFTPNEAIKDQQASSFQEIPTATSQGGNVKFHYQRSVLDAGEINIQYVPTKQQAADGLTKPLGPKESASFHDRLTAPHFQLTENRKVCGHLKNLTKDFLVEMTPNAAIVRRPLEDRTVLIQSWIPIHGEETQALKYTDAQPNGALTAFVAPHLSSLPFGQPPETQIEHSTGINRGP
ncbi:uncharacterized protein KD926_001536 [Aspergillus affinis]|uniref:uncharacterized protein n=1 Tax=Aspergillus affinis TaxID=1070780 RepID=UPI0022FEA1B0|nr:uncharacterized protein KD926_001536 [Aspergillus affinis]KAI9044305.1 hypothetical protein KD926_001536 [Aspergillus affinis]